MMRILLFLFSNNFFSFANYIAFFMLGYEVFINRRIALVKVKTPAFLFLVVGSLAFMTISMYNGYDLTSSTFCLRFIVPILLFYIGYTRGMKGFESLKVDVYWISFATFIHGFLNVITNRNVNILTIAGRQYQDIYGGPISATLQNLFFVLSSALFFYFLVYEKRKSLKIIGVFATLGGVYGSIANASRTLLYVTVLIFIMCLFLHLVLTHNIASGIIRGIIVVCGILLIVFTIMWLDLFGVQEWFVNTALGQRELTSVVRNSISQNSRWVYAGDILELLPQYPLGNMPYNHFAHNLWVDIAKETGVIPFILYIAFVIAALFEGGKYFFNVKGESEKAIFIAAIIVAHVLVFFTEPIMEGSPLMFAIFCFIVGGVSSLTKNMGT